MDTKGYVLIAQEFRATKIWPNKQLKLEGTIDLEAEYKASLAGKVVPVMDISTNGDAYLVIGNSSLVGHFLWQIEAKDVV